MQSVLGHKLRSLLTMLGIIIGIASIITIVSTIKGTNEQIKQNIIGSGTNAVVVKLYQNEYPYDLAYSEIPDGIRLPDEEVRQQLADIRSADGASLYHYREYADGIYYGKNYFSGNVYGIDEHYLNVCGYQLCYGRDFLQSDYDDKMKVAIIDTNAAASLLPGENPIGKTVEIMGTPFVIIGVVTRVSDFTPVINNINDYYTYNSSSSGSLFVPDSVWAAVYRFDEPVTAAIRAASTDDMTSIGKKAADIMTDCCITNGGAEFSYRSEDLLEQAQQLQAMSNSTNRQLIWIASISLLVGGIGVMNIMLVSVTERTSEIGLKKAIGAKKKRIMTQFLTEAAVLTSFGGVIGVILGIIMALLISKIMATPSAISLPAILIAVVFSTIIGVVFGMLPAMKAAKLNPIEALRRE